jgi:hypothetical protein
VCGERVLDQLMAVVESLAFPERGSYPKELVGIKEYRQTFFKPYA